MKKYEENWERRKKLNRIFRTCVLKTAQAFLSGDHLTLMEEAFRDFVPRTKHDEALQSSLNACRKGTREKRLLRGLVMGCVGERKGKQMIARDVICESELLKVGIGKESSEEDEDVTDNW